MSIQEQVAVFHAAMGVGRRFTPQVPSDDQVRVRLCLITEEYFELLVACMNGASERAHLAAIYQLMSGVVNRYPIDVDLPEAADALADLAYVVEGANQVFGIDSEGVLREVHRANMAKVGGGMREDGKFLKPAGWQPPDIAGELRRQGGK